MLAGIKGEVRRRCVLAQLELKSPTDVPDFILEPLLSDADRRMWGAIHPQMMGGEYLPEDLTGETTIARVSLQSTTGDVIEVRARPSVAGIGYRIVDEYETEFKLPFVETAVPLTTAELIQLLDESQGMLDFAIGLVLPVVAWNFDGGPWGHEDMAVWRRRACAFARVTSAFYPGLDDWYSERLEALIDGIVEENGQAPEAAAEEVSQ